MGALARAAVALGVSLSGSAFAQGFQDALGPGAEARALGGAVSAGARGAQAGFVNPAGLGRTERPELYLGMGLSGTNRRATPEGVALAIGSEVELTPLPSVGVAVPLLPWLVLGAHALPAGFQGAAYQIDVGGTEQRDARSFRMVEAGPDVALRIPEELLPGALAFGFGYRVTGGELYRLRGSTLAAETSLDLAGADGTGIRAGIQYSPIPELRLGVTWQNRVSVVLGAPTGELDGQTLDQPQTIWTIPARVTLGLRADVDRYGLALEYRLADYSTSEITYRDEAGAGSVATQETGPLTAVHTGHLGGEYRLSRADYEFPLRLGYTFESTLGWGVSPFDTPPDPLSTISVGGGVHRRSWGANLAAGMRFGGGSGHEFHEWSLAVDFVVRLGR